MAEAEVEARELPAETAVRSGPQDGMYASRASVTQRPMSRTTLQPSVHDFNGNIINKALDADQTVWVVRKSYGHFKHHAPVASAPAVSTDFAYPVPASFRRGGAFSTVRWESSRLPKNAGGVNGFKVERINAWADEVHRRHVAMTARVRARLSPTKARVGGDRVIPTPSGISGISRLPYDECSFSLSLPENGVDRHELEDIRWTSLSRTSSRNANHPVTSLSRPATTGRYFDSSNGLRNIRSSQAVFRCRPNTATPCTGPGLKIKKVTLYQKELVT